MIFIVRKRALGDVMWAEPFLKYIIDRHKGKRIFIYTKYPEVFENYPYAKLTVQQNPKAYIKIIIKILAKLGSKRCYILDDVYEDDPQKHFLQAYYDRFNIKDGYMQYPSLKHFITKDKAVKRKTIIFHINNNNVPQLYRKVHGIDWAVIFQFVTSLGFEVLVINKKEEIDLKHITAPVNFFSGSLKELVNTINNSSYFIGLDSAPSHIAVSSGVPSIIFFGSVNPAYRHIMSEFRGFFLQSYCEKAGCYHVQPKAEQVCLINADQTIVPKCTVHTNEELISTIQKLIKRYEV